MWGEIEVDIMYTQAEKFLMMALNTNELVGAKKAGELGIKTTAQDILTFLSNEDLPDDMFTDTEYEFIRSLAVPENATEFECNAITSALNALAIGSVSPSQANIAVWAPKLCRDRRLAQDIKVNLEIALPTKSKQSIVCVFKGCKHVQTQYGESYVHTFEAYGSGLVIDGRGHMLEWWTGEDKSNGRAIDSSVVLTCKIKDHSVFNGKSRTRVTHCKF